MRNGWTLEALNIGGEETGTVSSGTNSSWWNKNNTPLRRSVGTDTDISQTIPFHKRAVSLKFLENLIYNQTRKILQSDDNCELLSNVRFVEVLEQVSSPGSNVVSTFKVRVVTDQDHRLFVFDQPKVAGGFQKRRTISELLSLQPALPQITVVEVTGPTSFYAEVDASFKDLLWGSELRMPLNMHKLAAEVVIPLTTLEEQVVELGVDGAKALVDHLGKSHTLTVLSPVVLYDIHGTRTFINKGMAVHGCLSESGHVRKSYWNRGNNRAEVWKTNTMDHGRDQWSVDPVAPGLAEEEGFLTVAKILERAPRGITVVLRRGVSYAEILPKRLKVTDFISHNWAGTSKDLLEALRAAQVQNAWICTLAVCQHSIPNLCEAFDTSPFYQVLDQLRYCGRVVMVLDEAATPLTRIWCVFEVWVSIALHIPFQMFLASGELNFLSKGIEACRARDKIVNLDMANASCSVEDDKVMILRVINGSEGGREAVAWQVKKQLSLGAVVVLNCLVADTSSYVFSLPFVYCFVEKWLDRTLYHDDQQHWQCRGLSTTLVTLSGMYHLRHWLVFVRASGPVTMFNVIWNALSIGSRDARLFTGISLLELLCVLLLAPMHQWRARKASHLIHHIFCGDTSLCQCVLLSVYWALKTLPWVVCFVWDRLLKRKTEWQEFMPAAPRIGILLAISSILVMNWQAYVDEGVDNAFCRKEVRDLTHLSFEDEDLVLIHIFIIGLAAWCCSVSWSFAIHTWRFFRRRRWWMYISGWTLIITICVALFVRMAYKNQIVPMWQQNWHHLEIGCGVWLVGSFIWYRPQVVRYFHWYVEMFFKS